MQCEEGPPCLYCIKKKQECIPQALPVKIGDVFINTSAPSKRSKLQVNPAKAPQLCSNVPMDVSTQFMRQFFSSFLATNNFGEGLSLENIVTQFQVSPSLHQAVVAVGGLDLSKTSPLSATEKRFIAVRALKAYGSAIVHLKTEISNKTFQHSEASLWTTLFLGLFEVSSYQLA
jgi:hypothetical protein